MIKLLFTIALCFSTFLTNAAEFKGTVTGLYINSDNTALVTLDTGTTSPDCNSGNYWDFKFNTTENYAKQWVSFLLAARMAEKPVQIGYTQSTTSYCSVNYVYFSG